MEHRVWYKYLSNWFQFAKNYLESNMIENILKCRLYYKKNFPCIHAHNKTCRCGKTHINTIFGKNYVLTQKVLFRFNSNMFKDNFDRL